MAFKSGFATFVGRPNAGKSTLLNAIIGSKIAITSSTAQTTRHRLRAIKTSDDFQLILVDTPGLHKPNDALGEELNTSALKALEDVDIVAMLIDASKPVGRGDAWVAAQVSACQAPKVLVLSKADLAMPEKVEEQKAAAMELAPWDAVCTCSAKKHEGVDELVELLVAYLPEGPQWFPSDMETDQSLEVIVAEFIREKILFAFRDEVPHAIGVQTDELAYVSKKKMYRISATVYVERESQKGMVIGKGGTSIKAIGTQARQDLERLLGEQVYLDLSVKVRKNWRRDANQIRRFGYGEGL